MKTVVSLSLVCLASTAWIACSGDDDTEGAPAPDGAVSSGSSGTSGASGSSNPGGGQNDAETPVGEQVKPELAVTSPREGRYVGERRVIVEGTASDNVGLASVSYTIGQAEPVEIEVAADGSFSFEAVPVPGETQIVVTARDEAGNQTEVTRTVHYGHRFSCGNSQSALVHEGKLYTWGRNELGQLGNGTLTSTWSADPAVVVPAMYERAEPDLAAVVTRQTFMLGLTKDGRVKSWGSNGSGQLGRSTPADCGTNGTTACGRTPELVAGIEDAVAIEAGFTHSLVLLANGTVLSFGNNSKGQLGRETAETFSATPAAIPGLSDIIALSAGSDFSVALKADGTVYAWGINDYGQIGQGAVDSDAHATPQAVPNVHGVSLAAANNNVYVLQADGGIVAWGQNNRGQVGNGTSEGPVLTPAVVLRGVNTPLTGIESIAADGLVGMALDGTGKTFAWGLGNLGQLGQGYLDDGERDLDHRTFASEVVAPASAQSGFVGLEIEVGAGGPAFVWTTEGKLYGWGWSFQGSLGGGGALLNTWAYSAPFLVFPQLQVPEQL